MKGLRFLFISYFLLAFTLFATANNGNTTTNRTASLEEQMVGIWKITESTIITLENGEIVNEHTEVDAGTMIFNIDGTGASQKAYGQEDFTWSITPDAKLSVINANDNSQYGNFTFTIPLENTGTQVWTTEVAQKRTDKTVQHQITLTVGK